MRGRTNLLLLAVVIGLLAGCATVYRRLTDIGSAYWTVAVDGDIDRGLTQFEQAATDAGAVSLGEATAQGGTYRLGRFTFGVWPVDNRLAVLAGAGPSGGADEKEIESALAAIVACVNRAGTARLGNLSRSTGMPELKPGLLRHEPVEKNVPGYGAYLDRMAKNVDERYQSLADQAKDFPCVGSFVAVSFILTPDGRVGRIAKVEAHGTGPAANIAVGAVTESAPFGPWSPDMRSALDPHGEELTFIFYFE